MVHASAGRVGHFLTQISKFLRASFFGLTSSAEKAEVSKQNGAEKALAKSF